MNAGSLVRLFVLSAIWGGSFLLIRIGAPALGPVPLMESRVVLAALFLSAVGMWWRRPLMWRAHWRHYLILGCFNSALPFLLFGYAAMSLPASIMSILNATSALWGALIATLWHRAPLSTRTLAGLALGVVCSGVAYLLYFRLIGDIGAAPALTVTFLIPLFGVLWGWMFLDEAVGWHTLAGVAAVVVGTALVTGFSLRMLATAKREPFHHD